MIITGPVPTQADITVGTIFTGKALARDISALTMGKVTAIGVTATGIIRTEGMATGVIRAGVMAMGIPMGVMAMEVILTGVRPARATRNQRRRESFGASRSCRNGAGSFDRYTQQDRAEVTMPLGRDVI